MFNSALLYELAVLKPYILPLLENITESHLYFSEVNRLNKFPEIFPGSGFQGIFLIIPY